LALSRKRFFTRFEMFDILIKSCVLLLTLPLLLFIIYDSSSNLLKKNQFTYTTDEDGCGSERLSWSEFLRELFFMGIAERKEWGKSRPFEVPYHRVDTLDFVLKELKDVNEQRPPRILQLDSGVGEETVALSLQCRELRRNGCDIISSGDWMRIGPRGVTNDTFRYFSMSLTRHHAWEGVFPWRSNRDYIIDQMMCNLIRIDVLYLTEVVSSRLEDDLNRFLPYIRPGGFVIGGYAEGVDEVLRNFTSTHRASMLRKVGSWAMRIRN
ncbi:hypothetical protein PRIPAC_71882, partial [Pristionchus pacificus]